MDEPTASLDPARRAELGALLQGLRARGARSSSRRTTRTSRATSRRASCACAMGVIVSGRTAEPTLRARPAKRALQQLQSQGFACDRQAFLTVRLAVAFLGCSSSARR